MSQKKDGLERLKAEIQNNDELNKQLAAETLEPRQPEIRVLDAPSDITQQELQEEIAEQAELPKELIRVESKTFGRTAIVQLPRSAFKKIMHSKRVRIGWTMCRADENLFVPKCENCARFGHPTTACRIKEKTTCTDCAGSHSQF